MRPKAAKQIIGGGPAPSVAALDLAELEPPLTLPPTFPQLLLI